ncbi:MAG: hypothetical protein ACOYYJ_02415 [Chloroflexota bacterium]
MVATSAILDQVTEELHISEDDLIRKSLYSYLERQLRLIQTEIFEIITRYNVANTEEFEKRYREGTLEEAASWRDYQRLDHLEYKQGQIRKLLDSLS